MFTLSSACGPALPPAKYFNEMEKEIHNQVIVAIILFAVLIVTVGVIIGCLARSLASRMTQPLAKLVDVVKALKRKDSPPTVSSVCYAVFASLCLANSRSP